ncbi:MAG: acireductone synthase [Rhodospirillaceae bacterium]|nr:acireductone synthase [Rhodospirillaceae bacterium]
MSLSLPRVTTVVTDIEGTTTPIAFVKDTLFPYARARIPAFLAAHAGEPVVAGICTAAAVLGGVEASDLGAISAVFLGWMDADAKVQPLKDIQGLIWRDGYARGELHGEVFPDAAICLRAWSARGMRLAVYSSGSVLAQKLLFGTTRFGDLAALFGDFFDTGTGPKRAADSYLKIAAALRARPENIVFLSDIAEELDAAAAAGMAAVQVVRPGEGTIAGGRHPAVGSFGDIVVGQAA